MASVNLMLNGEVKVRPVGKNTNGGIGFEVVISSQPDFSPYSVLAYTNTIEAANGVAAVVRKAQRAIKMVLDADKAMSGDFDD